MKHNGNFCFENSNSHIGQPQNEVSSCNVLLHCIPFTITTLPKFSRIIILFFSNAKKKVKVPFHVFSNHEQRWQNSFLQLLSCSRETATVRGTEKYSGVRPTHHLTVITRRKKVCWTDSQSKASTTLISETVVDCKFLLPVQLLNQMSLFCLLTTAEHFLHHQHKPKGGKRKKNHSDIFICRLKITDT